MFARFSLAFFRNGDACNALSEEKRNKMAVEIYALKVFVLFASAAFNCPPDAASFVCIVQGFSHLPR